MSDSQLPIWDYSLQYRNAWTPNPSTAHKPVRCLLIRFGTNAEKLNEVLLYFSADTSSVSDAICVRQSGETYALFMRHPLSEFTTYLDRLRDGKPISLQFTSPDDVTQRISLTLLAVPSESQRLAEEPNGHSTQPNRTKALSKTPQGKHPLLS